MISDAKREEIKNAILVAPFAYGVQSELMPEEEFNHRRKAFENSRWYLEPKSELDKLINAEVTSVLEELEKAGQNALNHTGERDALRGSIQKIKERYSDKCN